jgi:hypothetical protein
MKKTIATIACLLACWLPANANDKKKAHPSPVEQEFGSMMRKQEAKARKEERSAPRPSPRTPAEELEMLNRFLAASAASKSATPSASVPARYNPSLPMLRAMNPNDGSNLFDIKSGAHLFDGNGNKRGKIDSGISQVKLNYGQSRQMRGSDGQMHTYYYAFATNLQGGDLVSGWVRATALVDRPQMPVVNAKRPPASPTTGYRITGDGVNQLYGDRKVVKNYDGPHRAAEDYGLRPGGYVNELLTLPGKGGMSTDTWKVGTTFNRVQSVPSVTRPLYRPGTADHVGDIRFVYGFVRTPTGPRFGWMASRALTLIRR